MQSERSLNSPTCSPHSSTERRLVTTGARRRMLAQRLTGARVTARYREKEEAVEEAGHQEAPPGAGGAKGVRSGDQQQGQGQQQLEEAPVQGHGPRGQRRGQAGHVGTEWEIFGEMEAINSYINKRLIVVLYWGLIF